MKKLVIISILAFGFSTYADIMKDFDSLGGNDALLEQAQALEPKTEVRVVQKRIVNRILRHEASVEVGTNLGGDPYLSTQSISLSYHFHINPRWSVGLKYDQYFNDFTEEGKRIQTNSKANLDGRLVPVQDWPESSSNLLLNWYPVYGKFSLYDLGVVQFDGYLSLGLGKISLKNGEKDARSIGLGMGFWISQNLVSRFEFRYQNYEATRFDKGTVMDITQATVSIGTLL